MDKQDANMLQYCACFRLRAAARKITRAYEDALKPVGLRATQFTLLSMITGVEPDSITDLAENVGMDRTALNRALTIMMKNGWVTVKGCDQSLEKKIRITAKGKKKLESAIPLWKDTQQKFIADSGKEQWEENRNWLINIAGGKHYQVV